MQAFPQHPHILVVDDDARLRSLLQRYLTKQDFIVSSAKDASEARVQCGFFSFDLIILDVMMPKETGVEFATDFRKIHTTPILMLTAMSESEDRIAGFEAGADDYLAKPFEPRELVLRIRSILSRTMTQPVSDVVTFGAFSYDPSRNQLMKGDAAVYATQSEMALLGILVSNKGTVVSRDDLAVAISKDAEEVNPRSVDVLITRLRKKIEEEPSRPTVLQTVRGAGYIIR